MKPESIAVDVGTGAVKVECFTHDCVPIGSAVGSYSMESASPEAIDPEVWYRGFAAAIKTLRETAALDSVRRVVLSGQMQDLILVSGGRAIDDALMYYTVRPGSAFTALVERTGRSRILSLTHNVPDAAGFPAKLLSIAEDSRGAELLLSTDHLLCGAHDYIAYRLTGTAATDRTTASTTGLFDPVSARWVEEIVETLPIDMDQLPAVVPGNRSDGRMSREAAAELGLPENVEVIHGVGDVATSTLAMEQAGYSRSCYLGTSGWILDVCPLTEPADPERGIFNLRHPTDDSLIRVTPLLTAAGAFDWFISTIDHRGDSRDELFDALSRESAGLSPADGHVLFLPYLAGERSPFKDPGASACFLGIRNGTGRRELFRAVQEGVAFALRSVFGALLGEEEGPYDRSADVPLLLTGGGALVSGFPQLLADVLRSDVDVLPETRFIGIRSLPVLTAGDANAGEGVIRENVVRYSPQYPNDVYKRKYDLFREAYEQTKELIHALSE